MTYEHLSALDSAFLYLERTAPLNVGSVAIVEGGQLGDDGAAGLAALRELVAGRLHLLPRFRQKVQEVPFGLGHPVWVDDPDFDLAGHVRAARLPEPGGQGELNELFAAIQAEPLDRRRPLWELWVVTGLAGGRAALIQKTHHALVDGISGVDAARALTDRAPHPPAPAPIDAGWEPQVAPSASTLVAGSVVGHAAGTARLVRSAGRAVRAPARTAATAARLAGTLWAGVQPVAPCPFNVAVGPRRRFDTCSVDLHDVRAVKRAVGCTANDVVLAIVAGGLRRHLGAGGEPVEAGPVRAMVPVSIRRRSERMTLGNRVSAVFADLPVHLADPLDQVRATSAEMDRLKSARHAEGVDWLLTAAGLAPAPLYAAAAARLPSWQQTVNLVVTNVPGPAAPMYCMGGQVTEAYPYLGPVGHLGLMVSVLRYNRRLFFGIAADPDALTDTAGLADAIEKSAAELLTAPT